MIGRSGPSYSPQARAWSNGGGWAVHRAQRLALVIRHDFSGSPQQSHHGGLTVRMELQHRRHTGPRRPVPSPRPQAAHAGSNSAASAASAHRVIATAPFGSKKLASVLWRLADVHRGPQPRVWQIPRGARPAQGAETSIGSAPPHSRSSA